MGQIRFHASSQLRLPEMVSAHSYMSGIDGIPWQGRSWWENDVLVHERTTTSESGNFYVPWFDADGRLLALCTASLMERPDAYELTRELARGTLNRVRNLASDLLEANYLIPTETSEVMQRAIAELASSVTSNGDHESASQQAIDLALVAAEQLVETYCHQAMENRLKDQGKVPTLCLGQLDRLFDSAEQEQQFLSAFNGAALSIRWKDVEATEGEFDWESTDKLIDWCQENQMKVCAGPLFKMDRVNLPDWCYLWDEDFDQLQRYVARFLEAVVQRYSSRVHVWDCASAVNLPGEMDLGEEERLKLAVLSIETVRRAAPRTPVIIRFDQPWGEYLVNVDMELSPLHFADALVRAQVGIAGVGIDINLGYWPGGTVPRDMIEISRMIDRWSLLGVPLMVGISAPSHAPEEEPEGILLPEGATPPNAEWQADCVKHLLPLLLCKPNIHGVVWNRFTDQSQHRLPFAGLIDAEGQAKPALEIFANVRERYLQ